MNKQTIPFVENLIQYFEKLIQQETNIERKQILIDNKIHLEELLYKFWNEKINHVNMRRILFQCSIDVLGEKIDIKIIEDIDNGFKTYCFTQSVYLQNENTIAAYKPGSGAIDITLEGLLFKIESYRKQFTKIIGKEINLDF